MLPSLNSLLPVSDVVREIGGHVNSLPGYCRCPVCGRVSLYASDSGPQHGGWYVCQGECGFAGDSVDLLAAASREPVPDFLRKRRLADAALYSPQNLRSHMEAYRRRLDINKFWKTVSAKLNNAVYEPEVADLLKRLRLSNHVQTQDWEGGSGRIFGYGAADALRKGLSGFDVPGTKNHPWVVSPLFSAPQKITGFACFDEHPESYECFVEKGRDARDALLFLTGPVRTGDVFAMDRGKYGLALHILARNMHAPVPPVLGYLPESQLVWSHVRADRVILWAPVPDVDVLVMARAIGDRAHIASRPVLYPHTDDPFVQFLGQTPAMVMEAMRASAVPWLSALKDYIVSAGRTDAVDAVPDRISLTPHELEKLRSLCAGEDERRILASVYSGGSIDVSLTLPSGRKVVRKDSGWHRAIKGGEYALLSQAMPVIEDQIVGDGGETRYAGYIAIGGEAERLRFGIEKAEFTPEWLARICAEAGKFVTVGGMTAGEMYQIATGLHRPRVVRAVKDIGWSHRDGCYALPMFTVLPDGSIDDEPRRTAAPHPAERIPLHAEPEPGEVGEWFGTTRCTGFWHVYLCGLSVVTGPRTGLECPGTAVYCPDGPEALTAVAAALYARIGVKASGERGWPEFVVPTSRHEEAAIIKAGCGRPVIAAVTIEETMRLAQLLGWNTVTVSGGNEAPPPGAHKLLPGLLVQSITQAREPLAGAIRAAYDILAGLLGGKYNAKPPMELLRGIHAPDQTWAGKAERWVKLALLLAEAGLLRLDHIGKAQPLAPVKGVIVVRGSEMILPAELPKVMEADGMDAPTLSELNQAMEAHTGHKETCMRLGRLLGWRINND